MTKGLDLLPPPTAARKHVPKTFFFDFSEFFAVSAIFNRSQSTGFGRLAVVAAESRAVSPTIDGFGRFFRVRCFSPASR